MRPKLERERSRGTTRVASKAFVSDEASGRAEVVQHSNSAWDVDDWYDSFVWSAFRLLSNFPYTNDFIKSGPVKMSQIQAFQVGPSQSIEARRHEVASSILAFAKLHFPAMKYENGEDYYSVVGEIVESTKDNEKTLLGISMLLGSKVDIGAGSSDSFK